MKFLCLMPVWNHRTDTIQNAVQCFLDRTYPEADLLIIDDRPRDSQFTRNEAPGDRVLYWRAAGRFDSLPAKYNAALWQYKNFYQRDYDAISIWDDDDGFLPRHLELAAKAYHDIPTTFWTYPEEILFYHNGITRKAPRGAFWSSCTFRKECLEKGKFPETKAVGHDQMFLTRLAREFDHPTLIPTPTYIYRWGTGESHCSGLAGDFHDETWWGKTPPSHSACPMVPGYDENYVHILGEIKRDHREVLK